MISQGVLILAWWNTSLKTFLIQLHLWVLLQWYYCTFFSPFHGTFFLECCGFFCGHVFFVVLSGFYCLFCVWGGYCWRCGVFVLLCFCLVLVLWGFFKSFTNTCIISWLKAYVHCHLFSLSKVYLLLACRSWPMTFLSILSMDFRLPCFITSSSEPRGPEQNRLWIMLLESVGLLVWVSAHQQEPGSHAWVLSCEKGNALCHWFTQVRSERVQK